MIVVDTHTLLWWVNGERSRLSDEAFRAIEEARSGDGVCASSITAWEIAMLVFKDRLDLSLDVLTWLGLVEQIDGFRFVPIDNLVAVRSRSLPGDSHADPADRIIVALTRELDAPVVTKNAEIRRYPHVRTIW